MREQFMYLLICAILSELTVGSRKIKNDASELEVGMAIRTDDCLDELSTEESSSCYEGPTTPTTTRKPWVIVTPRTNKLPNGPFSGFLVNICNALMSTRFSRRHVGRYFQVLSKSLAGLGIDFVQKIWIRRLRKRLKRYSIYNKHTLKTRVYQFLIFISDGKPKKNEYFKAMNAIYSLRDDFKMDDYVYLLKNYGKGRLLHIGDKTREVFETLIFGTFHKQTEEVKDDIVLKFKSAAIEYWEEKLNGTVFNFTIRAP